MRIIRTTFILFIALALSACASEFVQPGNTGTLKQLQKIRGRRITRSNHTKAATTSKIRLNALKNTALSLGARAGLAYRAAQIDKLLTHKKQFLTRTYNFYGLMLNHNVMPPVLVEAQNTLNLAGPDVIRLASKVYKIQQQAHFVTAPLTWHDYLWMNYAKPKVPNGTLLPQNPKEQQIWNHIVAIGWKEGIAQANNIYEANLARLNRDYNGMVLYHKLYEENMVSAPFVAKTELGITGNGSNMRVGDKVLRITALPQLNLHGDNWKPGLIPAEPAPPKLALHPAHYQGQSK